MACFITFDCSFLNELLDDLARFCGLGQIYHSNRHFSIFSSKKKETTEFCVSFCSIDNKQGVNTASSASKDDTQSSPKSETLIIAHENVVTNVSENFRLTEMEFVVNFDIPAEEYETSFPTTNFVPNLIAEINSIDEMEIVFDEKPSDCTNIEYDWSNDDNTFMSQNSSIFGEFGFEERDYKSKINDQFFDDHENTQLEPILNFLTPDFEYNYSKGNHNTTIPQQKQQTENEMINSNQILPKPVLAIEDSWGWFIEPSDCSNF